MDKLLITLFPMVMAAPLCGFVRLNCDRLEKVSTTTHGIGLRSRSSLFDGSRYSCCITVPASSGNWNAKLMRCRSWNEGRG